MKNSWLLKLSILATVLAMLTGCPALSFGLNVDMPSEGFDKINAIMVDSLKKIKDSTERLKLINEMESSLTATSSMLKQHPQSCNEIDKIDNMINYLREVREGNNVFSTIANKVPMFVDNLDWLGAGQNKKCCSDKTNAIINYYISEKPTLKELAEKLKQEGLACKEFIESLSGIYGELMFSILNLKCYVAHGHYNNCWDKRKEYSDLANALRNIILLSNDFAGGLSNSYLNADGDSVNFHVFNPLREKIVLDWNKEAIPGEPGGLESLKSVYDEYQKKGQKPPKVIINAGFFDMPKEKEICNNDCKGNKDCLEACTIGGKNLSNGWAYSDNDQLKAYKNSTYKNLTKDLHQKEKDDPCKDYSFENFRTLFYYKDGSSKIFSSCKIRRDFFEEEAKKSIFVISGYDNIDGKNNTARARTIIGIKDDGTIILWTVDEGKGLKISDAKKEVEKMGVKADKILNLDGGGSTQFFYNGNEKTRNNRKVGSRFLIFDLQADLPCSGPVL